MVINISATTPCTIAPDAFNDDYNNYVINLPASNWQAYIDNENWSRYDYAFRVNGVAPEFKSIPSHQIWYTSTDQKIVELMNDKGLISVVSNVYDKENDKGVITCAGRIETIGQSVFYDVDNLKTVILPKHVRTIMTTAFANIPTLESVTLPKNLKNIYGGAFAGNKSALKTVFCDIATPPTGASGMFDATFTGTIYVPLGSVSLYQSADYWKKCNIQGYEF